MSAVRDVKAADDSFGSSLARSLTREHERGVGIFVVHKPDDASIHLADIERVQAFTEAGVDDPALDCLACTRLDHRATGDTERARSYRGSR
jgi:hypothetical protein